MLHGGVYAAVTVLYVYMICQVHADINNCKCTKNGPQMRTRMIYGEDVSFDEFPFMAGVIPMTEDQRYSCWNITCGAIIITLRHVLTAAHCVQSERNYAVAVGFSYIEDCSNGLAQIRESEGVVKHGSYNPDTMEFDIALILLKEELDFSSGRLGSVCLVPKTQGSSESNFKSLGWGVTSFEPEGSNVLQEISLVEFDFAQCKEIYSEDQLQPKHDDSQICAKGQGQGPCLGDSGGPLLWQDPDTGEYLLEGILSFGVENCTTRIPFVYTRMIYFLPWIRDNINYNLCGLGFLTDS